MPQTPEDREKARQHPGLNGYCCIAPNGEQADAWATSALEAQYEGARQLGIPRRRSYHVAVYLCILAISADESREIVHVATE